MVCFEVVSELNLAHLSMISFYIPRNIIFYLFDFFLKGGAAQLPSPLPAPRSPALAPTHTMLSSTISIIHFIALSALSEHKNI